MTDAAVADTPRRSGPWTVPAVEFLAREGFIVIFAAWAVYLAFASEHFLTHDNLLLLVRQAAIFAIVGIGATMVTILGELDISFGATLAFAGCVAAAWVIGGTQPYLGIAIAIGIGAVIGLVNGLLVNVVRIPSVVATLGVMGAVEGLAQMYTGGSSIFGDELDRLQFLSRDEFLNIPIPVLIAVGLYVAAWWLTTRTRFGAHLFATGDNREAAYRAGIRVQRIRLIVFVTAGALAGFAGLMQVTRIGRAQSGIGADALFPVLTAVILGGASLHGGRGRIVNTFIASVFLASITNGLILLGVASEVQRLVQGAVLVAAVSLDRLRT
jgi:ribose/xylose/arabinose/galactoside ABC-type transport system permease subunit